MLTCLFTFPLIFNFGSLLPGDLIEDRDQNIWNLWWVREAITHLRNPFRSDFLYYPDNTSLYFHTLHPLNGLISAPVQGLFGMVPAYNFIVFFSFIMAGWGAYLLLNYLCDNPVAAFAGSMIFAYSPYHTGTLKGVMQLISLEWLPFYIFFLLKATRDERGWLKNSLLAAFFLLCTALTDWYYTLFLLGFTVLYLLWLGLDKLLKGRLEKSLPQPKFWLKCYGPAGLALLVFFLAISPVLIPMLRELNSTSYYLPDPADTRKFSADLTAFFIPPATSSFLGWVGQDIRFNYVTGPLAAQVYIGYIALALAILGVIVSRKAWFWGLTGLAFWLLTLGPALRVNGPEPGWPMPFALLENLPVVKITRSPDRFIVITMLCLAVCTALATGWLMNRFPRRKLVPAALAGVLIGLEFLQIPYPLNDFKVSPFFEQLGKDKADYSLLELPPQGGFWTGADRMAEQTIHGKRIFDGYISREYDHPFQRRVPGFRELTTLQFDRDIFLPDPGDSQTRRAWYDAFAYYKVRYIILRLPQNDKQRASANLDKYRAAIARVAPGEAVYKDEYLEAYALPAASQSPRPFLELGDGWQEPEQTAGTSAYHRWASGSAGLYLSWQGPGETQTTLNLSLGTLDGQKPVWLLLDGKVVWQATLNPGLNPYKIPLAVGPGRHTLELQVDGTAVSPTSLGMGNDPRKLLYLIAAVNLG